MSRSPVKQRTTGPSIDFVVASPLWKAQPDVKSAVRRAIAAAAASVSTTDGELAIVLTDDSDIRALNRTWRGRDEPTNVLSFPASARGADCRLPPPPGLRLRASGRRLLQGRVGKGGEVTRSKFAALPPSPRATCASLPHQGGKKSGRHTAPRLLGDIVIAYETTACEALAERKPFLHHLAHLAVHGFLHLLGYNHEADDEAAVMERLETVVLAQLDVPDPYIVGIAKA